MKPDPRYLNQPKHFWANVRLISEKNGYKVRGQDQFKTPSLDEPASTLKALDLSHEHITGHGATPTPFGRDLLNYFELRADRLRNEVEPNLTDVARARRLFLDLKAKFQPSCPLPMNKQSREKKAPAYLTGIINMLIEANAAGLPCDYDPRELTTVTMQNAPLRTFARRVDGAFPSTVNPIAVWETKEYYYTTTFGSRVADGVYESLLDGMELEELRKNENIEVRHYLMVDALYTWWDCGKSYLCRLFDMMHMGYVDEVLFGYEIVDRLPELVREWVRLANESGR